MPDRHAKIAVIFARNTKNLGMYSVDLAGYEVLRTVSQHIDYFAESKSNVEKFQYGSISVNRYTSSEQLFSYDKVIYWGDFTTSVPYARREYFNVHASDYFPYSRRLIKAGVRKRSVQKAVLRRWEDLYLPKFADKAYYSIGQNFQTMTRKIFDTLDSTSQKKYRQFHSILARDSASVQNLNVMFHGEAARPTVQQICDLGFLVGVQPKNVSPATSKRTVGVYFRRSKIENTPEILNAIARKTNVILFTDWIEEGMDFDATFKKNIALLRDCDFVVSDTYHFLINALREGCSAIGLGNVQSEQVSTIGDYKKKVLFSDTGLSEFYVELSDKALDKCGLDRVLHLLATSGDEYWGTYRVDRHKTIQDIRSVLAAA